MSEKLTLAQRRHKFALNCTRVYAGALTRLLFHYHGQRLPKLDGPVFMVSNHNTDIDCVFLGMAAHGLIYFVATETLARMGFAGRFLMYWFDPILHAKGSVGTATSRAILTRLREGHSVGLFPEGNRSFNGRTCPIPPATGKLAKLAGATLVTYRFIGGYFTTPRWGRGIRKGRMDGRVMGIYSPETLKAMSAQEVQAAIERDLYTDAYAEQAERPTRFRGRAPAEHLESMLFLCPSCGKIGTLRSEKDSLSCACGYTMRFTPYGYLEDESGTQHTITALDDAQREHLARLAQDAGEEPLFSDSVRMRRVEADHSVTKEQDILLSACADRLILGGETLPMADIESMSIVQRNQLLIQRAQDRGHYEFTGAPGFSALKYLYLLRIAHPSANGSL